MSIRAIISRLIVREAIFPFLLCAAFFVLYVHTLSPGLLTADNGEFQLVGVLLGVAHPPGFPLYTMLAHAASLLPLGDDPAWRINLLSAAISVATLLLVYLTTRKLTGSIAAGLLAAAVLGISTTFWAQATTANIRSLTAFFAALAIFALAADHRPQTADRRPQTANDYWRPADGRRRSTVPLLALALSLGLTHHLSLAFMAAVFGIALLWQRPSLWREPREWLWLGLAAVAGLLPLLYLPWRAAVGAYNAPADLTTLNGFLYHVLAQGFRGDFFYFMEPALLWERLRVMGNVLTFQWNGWLLAAALFGLIVAFWRDRWLGFLLGGSFAVHAFITATYRAPQTVEYMLPAYVPLAICVGMAVHPQITQILDRWSAVGGRPSAVGGQWSAVARSLLLVGLATAVLLQAVDRYSAFAALSREEIARDYAAPILQDAPPGALVLADWHWVTPLWYLQTAEGVRPDLEIAFVYPSGEPYETTWARHIETGLDDGRDVVSTHFNPRGYAHLPPPEPLGEAHLFRPRPRQTMPAHFQPLPLEWQNGLRLLGYELSSTAVPVGDELVVTLAWEMGGEETATLFLHLVGFDGRLYAQQDLPLRPVEGVGLTQFRLTPRPGAPLGDLALFVGAYGAEPILFADGQERVQLAAVAATPSPWKPVTANSIYRAETESDRLLIGYDWDGSLPGQWRLYLHWRLPGGYWSETIDTAEGVTLTGLRNRWGWARPLRLDPPAASHYVPMGQGIVWTGANNPGPLAAGETAVWRLRFGANRPVLRDLMIAAALIGYEPDGFHWAWRMQDDGVPAMGGIPTLKWTAGSIIISPHWLTLDETAAPGQKVIGTISMYDAFTHRPLPILDERLTGEAPWIPLPVTVRSMDGGRPTADRSAGE